MYRRLLVPVIFSSPLRMSFMRSLTSRAPVLGSGQVRCLKGAGFCFVFGGHENGSRASMGTIQLLMLVPRRALTSANEAYIQSHGSFMYQILSSGMVPVDASQTIDDLLQTNHSAIRSRICVLWLPRSPLCCRGGSVWTRSNPFQVHSPFFGWDWRMINQNLHGIQASSSIPIDRLRIDGTGEGHVLRSMQIPRGWYDGRRSTVVDRWRVPPVFGNRSRAHTGGTVLAMLKGRVEVGVSIDLHRKMVLNIFKWDETV